MAEDSMSFGQAFREAKKAGLPEFDWRGRKFSTQTAGEAKAPQWQPQLVPGMAPQNPVNLQQPMPQAVPQMPEFARGTPGTPGSATMPLMAPGIEVRGTPPVDAFQEAGTDTSWMVEPPKTPEERAGRVSQWQDVMGKITGNPMLLMAMLRMGTQLMQPIQPGQSVGGHFGQALAGTVDYMQALGMANRKATMEEARTSADIEQGRAATELARNRDAREAARAPEELNVLRQQLANAKTQEEVNKLELSIKKFQSRPEYMQQLADMEKSKLQIQLDAEKARIAAYQAALARANRESSAITNAERKMQAEIEASVEYVMKVDEGIALLAEELTKKSGREVPFAIARERFLEGKPTLADHYWKYVGLAEKARAKAAVAGGVPAPGTGAGGKPTPPQSDAQVRDRTLGQEGYTIIRQPDGSLKAVPVKPVTTGKPERMDSSYGAAP